jgi:hypothetical protein
MTFMWSQHRIEPSLTSTPATAFSFRGVLELARPHVRDTFAEHRYEQPSVFVG